MDINKMLKDISNLSQYINISQDTLTDARTPNVKFNLSAVLALKKIRCLEIEYFHKYEASGVAVKVFGILLDHPPSKTWGLLSKELISLLQYWLEALRKHLLNHSPHWWMFLKTLLNFIKIIRQKHASIPNILVLETADCLLDLATHIQLDVQQRYEVLSCFNLYCADSNREVRVGMKSKLDGYFIKLCTVMSACGHFPTQHSILEAVLRWTIGRQDKNVRTLTVQKWFLTSLYSSKAIALFLEKKWTDFFQDARQFLNVQNEATRLVTSVICKKLTVGDVVVVSGSEKKETWLDINSKSRTLTLLLDPRYLDMLGSSSDSCYETLTICHRATEDVILTRELSETIIVLSIQGSIELYPSSAKIDCDGDRQVRAYVSGRSDHSKLDYALRTVFEDKYKLLLDLNATTVTTSPTEAKKKTAASSELGSSLKPVNDTDGLPIHLKEDESRFSHPVGPRKSNRSGCVVRTRFDALRSPSTASTSSLAQLQEKLAALPRFRYDKEPVSVVAQPELSNVTELTEPNLSSLNTTASTFKLRHCGDFNRSFRNVNANDSRKSQSDGEIKENKNKSKCISPSVHDENSISCLLVATIGTTDESAINETIEKLPKNKGYTTYNIVDLLMQEALQAKTISKDKSNDIGINTAEKKTQDDSEIVENTPFEDVIKNAPMSKSLNQNIQAKQIIRNNSTSSNESNTEELNEICESQHNFVNLRKRKSPYTNSKINEDAIEEKLHIFDGQVVENFFSQNLTEHAHGDLVISPTLAKKINETSSESSDFDYNLNDDDFNDNMPIVNEVDIVSCLNEMLDKVCTDLDKCAEFLTQKQKSKVMEQINDTGSDRKNKSPVAILDTDNKENEIKNTSSVTPQQKSTRQKRSIKPKQKTVTKKERLAKPKVIKKKNSKLELETNTKIKMSTINELDEILEEEQSNVKLDNPQVPNLRSPVNNDIDTPLLKRKRKLYSPKQDEILIEKTVSKPAVKIPETEGEDTTLSGLQPVQNIASNIASNMASLATPYKEIERERKRIRKPRVRKSKAQSEPPLSPRTIKKNALFDQMKDKVESNESILIADKNKDVYNFTSDSEDEDFKKKKIEVSKRASTTTIGSFDSTVSKRGRLTNRVNYTEKKSDSTVEENKPITRQRRNKRQNLRTKRSKPNLVPDNELVDERMREAVDVLNTSVIVEEPTKVTHEEPTPIRNVSPEMEVIVDTEPKANKIESKTDKQVPKRAPRKIKQNLKALAIKKEKGVCQKSDLEVLCIKDDDGTVSPLPCLVVEREVEHNNDNMDDSIRMMKRFKKIMKDGPTAAINITNTTQNLLSDIEQINCSPEMNITEEVNRCFNDATETVNKTTPKKQTRSFTKKYNLRNKDDLKMKRQQSSIEIITIRTISDAKSEKSIESAGITGHGDTDEMPPDPELLQQPFAPRNMELQDLDQSTADYFLKLTREMNKSPSSSESKKTKESPNKPLPETSSGIQSPIVRLVRMPSGDIHEWLPPPPSTDSELEVSEDDQKKPEEKISQFKQVKRLEKTNKSKETFKAHSDDEDKIEVVKEKKPKKLKKSVKKDSSKTEKTSNEIQEERSSKSKILEEKEKHKKLKSPSPLSPKEQSPILRSSTQKRTTTISPINICFEDFNINSPKSQKTSKSKEISNKKDSNTGSITKQSSESFKLKLFCLQESERSASPLSSISSHSKIVSTPVKRNAPCKVSGGKKARTIVEEIEGIVQIESGPSVSSVADWFDKIPQITKVENEVTALCKDSIDIVMEKLDTTLAEIHQNTSKKFINLFVDAQKQLQQQKDERRQLYKETAKNIMLSITQVIDDKYCEMEKRSQELDKQFMENLKSRACDMIKDDCKQKRAMVVLLKEDVQAATDHLQRLKRQKK